MPLFHPFQLEFDFFDHLDYSHAELNQLEANFHQIILVAA